MERYQNAWTHTKTHHIIETKTVKGKKTAINQLALKNRIAHPLRVHAHQCTTHKYVLDGNHEVKRKQKPRKEFPLITSNCLSDTCACEIRSRSVKQSIQM